MATTNTSIGRHVAAKMKGDERIEVGGRAFDIRQGHVARRPERAHVVGDEFEQQRLLGVDVIVERSGCCPLLQSASALRIGKSERKQRLSAILASPGSSLFSGKGVHVGRIKRDRSVGKNRMLASSIAP